MQLEFESRFNNYLPLLSDKENACNFLTVLFNRIIHLLRKHEWVNDEILLHRFHASIQKPSQKTKEIYQIFVDRIGLNPRLESIKEIIDAVHSQERIQAQDAASPKMEVTHSTPKIEMTRSRFTAKFLACIKASSASVWNRDENYLTEEGKNLDDSHKLALDKGIAYCDPLSSFRNYLESVNPSPLEEAAIKELKAFFNGIKGDELNEAEKTELNQIIIKYTPFPSPPVFNMEKSQLAKIKDKLKSDHISLYSLFNSPLIHEILKVKNKLLALVEEIENEETQAFKVFVELFLERIINGGSSEELKIDLRKIRTYLINHGKFEPGEFNIGNDADVFFPLLKILFPERHEHANAYYRNQISLKNDRIYVSTSKTEDSPQLAAGILISTHNHYTVSIFNGSHYIWIDQFKKIQKKTPDQMYAEIRKLSPETSFNFFLVPQSVEINEQPDPSKWTIPGWERNNCFIAATLVLIALMRFHRKNNPNL